MIGVLTKVYNLWSEVQNVQISNQTKRALFPYYARTLLLFSRPMRDKDTSALMEIFQYSSSVRSLSTNAR